MINDKFNITYSLKLLEYFGFPSENLYLTMSVFLQSSALFMSFIYHFNRNFFLCMRVHTLKDLSEGSFSNTFSHHETITADEHSRVLCNVSIVLNTILMMIMTIWVSIEQALIWRMIPSLSCTLVLVH